jgi:hypothetical protein
MSRDTSDEIYCLMKNGILLRSAKMMIREMEPEGVISQADIDKLAWAMGMLEDRIEAEQDRLAGERQHT